MAYKIKDRALLPGGMIDLCRETRYGIFSFCPGGHAGPGWGLVSGRIGIILNLAGLAAVFQRNLSARPGLFIATAFNLKQ